MAPDFVKIDVEGMELRSIPGAARLLAECRPVLMVGVKADTLRAAVQAYGDEIRAASRWRLSASDLPANGWRNVFALPAQA